MYGFQNCHRPPFSAVRGPTIGPPPLQNPGCTPANNAAYLTEKRRIESKRLKATDSVYVKRMKDKIKMVFVYVSDSFNLIIHVLYVNIDGCKKLFILGCDYHLILHIRVSLPLNSTY